MATQRQVRANRKNAQLSTGPRSIDGKRRAASNALKHGLTSKQILLPHEDAEAFEAFARDLRDAFAPIDAFEEFVVERIVTYAWRIRRATVFEAALHARAKQENVIEKLQLRMDEYVAAALRGAVCSEAPPTPPGYKRAEGKLQAAIRHLEEQPLWNATNVLEQYEREFANLTWREESLQGSMLKMVRELRRLQSERAGKLVAARAVVDVTPKLNSEGASIPDGEPGPDNVPGRASTPVHEKCNIL